MNETGCQKPCHFTEYKLVGEEKATLDGVMLLDFATNEVYIEKEMEKCGNM